MDASSLQLLLGIAVFIAFASVGLHISRKMVIHHHQLRRGQNWAAFLFGLAGFLLSTVLLVPFFHFFGFLFLLVCFVGLYGTVGLEIFSRSMIESIFGLEKGKAKRDYSLAKKYEVEERFDLAELEYRKTLEEDPSDNTARKHLAELYIRTERPNEALSLLWRCVEDAEDEGQAFSWAARIADVATGRLNDSKEAIRALESVIKKYPQSESANLTRRRIEQIASAFLKESN